MMAARFDFKRIHAKSDLHYLSDWYCPLEKQRLAGQDSPVGQNLKEKDTNRFILSLALNRPPLHWSLKQPVAGF
ncbi:MAG: hypothetical protein IMW93_04780 [Thermoanaerobacteraceae bacterium]|nr:hypothetical protein [Thermoanaerobacteraceae bacterium]